MEMTGGIDRRESNDMTEKVRTITCLAASSEKGAEEEEKRDIGRIEETQQFNCKWPLVQCASCRCVCG